MDSTKRFSNRVENYALYRPDYPVELIDYLQNKYNLTSDKIIADIGAGTGISTALFLKKGYKVFAVEPNSDMLNKASALLQFYEGFAQINGSAENTLLPDNSIDAIIAGQAFHWFDVEKSRIEFKRILKNQGLVVLIWNERNVSSEFELEYDELITRFANDYVKLSHRNIDADNVAAFFAPSSMNLETFSNQQLFNFEGLKGRLLSSSYMPLAEDNNFNEMISGLNTLFTKYQQSGKVKISYDTKVYSGIFK